MYLSICRDYEEMSVRCAQLIAAQIRLEPASVLGLATGSTPVGCYKELIRLYNEEGLDFSEIETINLDEYVGLSPENDQSYRYFMNHNLFDHVNVDPQLTHVPDGLRDNPQESAEAYETQAEWIGPIDMQLLGLGPNGHIGFNEPDDHFSVATHVVELTETTREANKRFFSSIDEVPTHAITLGIGQIMKARKVILIANGEAKAEALVKALFGPVTPEVPASILQLHPDLTVFCDEAAASKIVENGF